MASVSNALRLLQHHLTSVASSSRASPSSCFRVDLLTKIKSVTTTSSNSSGRRSLARMLADPENKGERQNHINFDILGTWDNRIDFPMLLQESIKSGKPIPKISIENCGVASVIGRRKENEDRFILEELSPNLLLFGVLDGHGGSACVDFCVKYLPNLMKSNLLESKLHPDDLSFSVYKSFVQINALFAQYAESNLVNSSQFNSGTTATVCILKDSRTLIIGHVGDSRGIMCKNGSSVTLTSDHNANDVLERKRIIDSGGHITHDSLGRQLVNGTLAMTRSIGDLNLKKYGVTAEPEIKSHEISHGKDSFIVITSDGVNSVMSDSEIVNCITHAETPADAAQYVTDSALNYASEDNSTAIVVPFGAWGKFKNSKNIHNLLVNSLGRQLAKSSRHD